VASLLGKRSRIRRGAAGLLALATVACNKGPAEESLQAAEQALAAAPEVEKYVPEEFAAVSQILSAARASFAAGRYTDALRAAQALPDRIAAAAAVAASRKEQSAATWSALSAELPAKFEAIDARLKLLSSLDAIAPERLAAARAELAALSQGWADASAMYERGDVPKATAAAEDVKAKAAMLAARVGPKRPPAVAPPAPAAPASPPPEDPRPGASA